VCVLVLRRGLLILNFSGCCRLPWQRSSIWSSSVVGMALHCKPFTPVMPRSILTILALGFWASPPRPGTVCGRLPRCAFAICESSSSVFITVIHHLIHSDINYLWGFSFAHTNFC
jgi:hypothetical protein